MRIGGYHTAADQIFDWLAACHVDLCDNGQKQAISPRGKKVEIPTHHGASEKH